MRRLSIIILFFALPMALGLTPKGPLYKDSTVGVPVRVADLLARMTLQEKIDMLSGTGFATQPNARLEIPELKMTDGPLGVRWYQATAFPSGISMSASFDRDLIRQVTNAMGEETRAKGRDMLLGPCVGISRVPFGGRNFESMGEDPFLTSEMAAAYVKGLNDQKVVGSVKHFALNDQEYRRMDINSIADERTMQEIHFPAYHRAVDVGVGTVMSSYNVVNGKHASENDELLNQTLKKKWGFKGFVVSDWISVHSTVPAALAGLDLEMPFAEYFGSDLLDAVQNKQVPESVIDDKVSRILTVIFQTGLFDGADKNRPDPSVINNQAHRDLALQMSREGHVLLKNQNRLLPLDGQTIKTIGVIGPNGGTPRSGGGGSSMVQPFHPVSIIDGMLTHVGPQATVSYAIGVQQPEEVAPIESFYLTPAQGEGHGLYAEIYNNKDLAGDPVSTRIDPSVNFSYDDSTSPAPGTAPQNFSVRWTGELTAPITGRYAIKTNSDDGLRLWLDDEPVIDNWLPHGPTINSKNLWFLAGHKYKIRLEYFQGSGNSIIQLGWDLPVEALKEDAIRVASQSDAVIMAVGFDSNTESEAQDRATFALPDGQDDLIAAVVKANPRTVLVINSGNPVDMRNWVDKVPAIVYAWYPGEQGGNALADIVMGNYNPSGRLPVTMLKRWEDSPAYGTYPETDGTVVYKEGIYVGYRHFDKAKVEPNFPFGHGLSYTQFEYTNLEIKANDATPDHPNVDVSVTITNTGHIAGAEVAQLYMRDLAPHVDRPMQELKGFQKVFLKAGESQQIKFKLNKMSFAYYDIEIHDWNVWPGQFSVRIGASSRDIRLEGSVDLREGSKAVALAK